MELFAYLDPGTGSIILQAVIGGVIGVGVLVKTYWHRLRSIFGKKSQTETKDLRE